MMLINKIKLLLISFALGAAPVLAKELDRVYAIVNEEVITKTEFNQETINTISELRSRGLQIPQESVLNRQVLERMISERLQLQVADRAGIVIPKSHIDEMVNEIATRNKMSMRQLKSALAKDNIPYQTFTKRLEDQLRIQQVIERQVNSNVVVSDQEIENFLRSERLANGNSKQFSVSHIIVPIIKNEGGLESAKKVINRAKKDLDNGLSFPVVAEKYSSHQDALNGGQMGWRKADEVPALYYQTLRTMQINQVSKPFQNGEAFHIIKLNDLRIGSNASSGEITQLRVRQILLRFSQKNSPEYLQIRLDEIKKQLNKGKNFDSLALQYSEDPVSRVKGGDLGWVGPGDLSGFAEQALKGLSNGQVTEPIQTVEGVSLFQVIDQRQRPAGNRLKENEARGKIHQKKAEKLYQDWVQQLRDRAYIEYLSDDMG